MRIILPYEMLDGAGRRLGALCVMDREPCRLRDREIQSLRALAELVSEEIQRQAALDKPAQGRPAVPTLGKV